MYLASTAQGYAVLPYEHNALKKKLRTLRLRMRQHHYKLLCAKSSKCHVQYSTNAPCWVR